MTIPGAVCIVLVALGLLTAPRLATAQPASKVARIAFLSSGNADQEATLLATLRERLRERGWVEGRNLDLDVRYAGGNYERVAELINGALRLNPDLLMTRGGPMTAGARRATTTVPIVMWGVTDPVGIGVVASLSRPGGNVTGLSDDQDPAIVGKRLQLLKQAAPAVSRSTVVTRVPPTDPGRPSAGATIPRVASYERAYESAGAALGATLRWSYLAGPDDIDKAFAQIAQDGPGALDVQYTPVTWAHRRQIIELAARHRRPAIYWHRGYVVDGGLMAYGEDEREVPKRLADYVDKILRGARPVDLPVEQPTKFELVINLKTAKALGLTVPQSMLLRADQVIE